MVIFRRFPTLATIVMTIIFSSHCQRVSNITETSESNYQKFMTNYVESSASKCGIILAKILDQIVELYLPEGKNHYCILTKNLMENNCFANALEEFLKLGTKNVITMIPGARNFDLNKIIYQKPSVYFLLGIDLSAVLEPLINFGKFSGTWNPRGLYICITKSKEEAVNVMTNLWKNFVYKVVVLVYRNNTLDTIEAYTWRPYYPRSYCGPPTLRNMIRLGNLTKTLRFQKETDIEPGTIPEKFGNCPFNISYNIWEPYVYSRAEDQKSALEVNLIEMVCDSIGVKVNPNYHSLLLTKEPSDAWAGSRIPLPLDVEKYEVSVPYIQDSFIWVIPCSQEFSLVELTSGFAASLWIPSILAMSITALSLMASGKQYWILWVWGSLWEQSDYEIPKKIRFIWACWLLLALHLSVAYKTALVSSITYPVASKTIQSQSELLESGLTMGFLSEAEPWFDEENEVDKKILDRYVPCETVAKCYKEIPKGRAVFTNKMFVNYLNGRRDEMGLIAEEMCELPTSLTYKIAMICAKGHAILPSFDKSLHFTLQTGFVKYWIDEIEETQKKIRMRRINFTKTSQLSLAYVSSGFELLAAGLITASLSFLYEIFSHWLLEKCSRYNIKGTTSFWNTKPK